MKPKSLSSSPMYTSIPIFFTTLTLLLSISSSAKAQNSSVYELLQSYDFPIGLLPVGVKTYELDQPTGRFSLYLDQAQDCLYTIEGYQLKYKTTITGTISKDKLTSLSGIEVKVLFLWLSIVEVTRDDDELELSVGFASADFPLDNFYECPQCGCGFDCVNKIKGKNGRLALLSTVKNFVSDYFFAN